MSTDGIEKLLIATENLHEAAVTRKRYFDYRGFLLLQLEVGKKRAMEIKPNVKLDIPAPDKQSQQILYKTATKTTVKKTEGLKPQPKRKRDEQANTTPASQIFVFGNSGIRPMSQIFTDVENVRATKKTPTKRHRFTLQQGN